MSGSLSLSLSRSRSLSRARALSLASNRFSNFLSVRLNRAQKLLRMLARANLVKACVFCVCVQEIEEAPAATPSASLQPSPLGVLQSLQNSFDGPAGGLLAPHESVRGGGGHAMAQQTYHNRANVRYESVPVAAYQAGVIPGDHHRLSAMQQGNQHRAPAWTPAPSMPQVQPVQYSAPIHTPHQHHTLQNQSSWRPPNAQAYPDDRWLGNGPERRNGHFGGHHSNHLPYTSRHGRPGEEGDRGGGWRGNNERGRHSKH